MKCLLVIVLFLGGGAIASAQVPAKSPKKVVEEFFRFEANGGRLTTEGWQKGAAFFVHPIPQPPKMDISVIYKDYSVGDQPVENNGDKARVIVDILPQGEIDSALRFTSSGFQKEGLVFDLILTKKHLELGPGGRMNEISGVPEWRIERSGPFIWLDVAAAIQYVTERRDKTNDPVIKKNAEVTLEKLKKSR